MKLQYGVQSHGLCRFEDASAGAGHSQIPASRSQARQRHQHLAEPATDDERRIRQIDQHVPGTRFHQLVQSSAKLIDPLIAYVNVSDHSHYRNLGGLSDAAYVDVHC